MEAYISSWRGGHFCEAELIIFPKSVEELSRLVKLCSDSDIKIIPQGGNTGLVAGAIPTGKYQEIIINLSHMKSIISIDKQNSNVIVEAGCTLAALQEAVADAGFFFPLSIASEGTAEVGGIISTNAGGTAVLKYGNTRDLTLGIEAILPDGSIYCDMKSLIKDNTGYDLKQLFIGAEGTLGIITKASFKIFPKINQQETAFLAVENINNAIEILHFMKEKSGNIVTTFEIISKTCLNLVVKHIDGARKPIETESLYYLLVELSTPESGDNLRIKFENMLGELFENGKILDAAIAESLKQTQDFWFIREHISEAERKSGRGIHFDISLPISKISSFINETDAKIAENTEAIIACFGHLGDGNLHYNMFLPHETDDERFNQTKSILSEIIYDNCENMGGSFSAEHGVGASRKHLLEKYKSPIELDLMKKIKQSIDPKNIMNPEKIVG